jgi:hypothetical protein
MFTEISNQRELLIEIESELERQHVRYDENTDKLQKAADTAAAADLAEQVAEYNTQKSKRDTLKTEYDALVAADDAGSIDAAGLSRLTELDMLYYAEEEEYQV